MSNCIPEVLAKDAKLKAQMFAKWQIAHEIGKLAEKGEILETDGLRWSLDPQQMIRLGGQLDDDDLEPFLLGTRTTVQGEEIIVSPLQQKLTGPPAHLLYNTDEKPLVILDSPDSTIVFKDLGTSCCDLVRAEGRMKNVTLLITSRGDGVLAYVTVILHGGKRFIQSEILEALQEHSKLPNSVPVSIVYTESGFVTSDIYIQHHRNVRNLAYC